MQMNPDSRTLKFRFMSRLYAKQFFPALQAKLDELQSRINDSNSKFKMDREILERKTDESEAYRDHYEKIKESQ